MNQPPDAFELNITKDKECTKEPQIPSFPATTFAPRYSRKVNIVKKIVRKFKKYLKSRQSPINYPFWICFSKENYFPPFKYENLEFKSFSQSYLRWLFSHDGGIELYRDYLNEKGKDELHNIYKEYGITDMNLQKDFEMYFREFSFLYSERKNFDLEYIQSSIDFILGVDEINENRINQSDCCSELFDRIAKEEIIIGNKKRKFNRSRDDINVNGNGSSIGVDWFEKVINSESSEGSECEQQLLPEMENICFNVESTLRRRGSENDGSDSGSGYNSPTGIEWEMNQNIKGDIIYEMDLLYVNIYYA